jgi:hypothetical protein
VHWRSSGNNPPGQIAKDTAVTARSQAMIALKVSWSPRQRTREQLESLNDTRLIETCRLSYDLMTGPSDAACYTLRTLVKRTTIWTGRLVYTDCVLPDSHPARRTRAD